MDFNKLTKQHLKNYKETIGFNLRNKKHMAF